MVDGDSLGRLGRLAGRVSGGGRRDGGGGRVGPALRVEAVGAADQQVGRSGDGQNPDVVLAFILGTKKHTFINDFMPSMYWCYL